jgi:Tol biopolymer transport system component
LWLVHPDGTERRWLYMAGDFTSDAVWSPDSTRVAVQAYADSTAGRQVLRIYLVNADGSTTVRLDGTTIPRWSPDGRFLVATEAGPAAAGFEPGSLILMNGDGSGRRSLGTSGIEGAGLVWLR